MTIHPILIAPHPILYRKTKVIEHINDEIINLLHDMKETLHHSTGIGLAAPQIGFSKRIVIIQIDRDDLKTGLIELINPQIISFSQETSLYEEGCLSLPGQYTEIQRPSNIVVQYLNRFGEEKTLQAEGLLSVCIQHEIDHLNGITLLQHVSRLKRDIMIRKLKRKIH